MSEQIIVLSGIIGNYDNEVVFYKMVGLFDQATKKFEGVEVITDRIESLKKIKEKIRTLDTISARVTTGILDEKIQYYKLDMQKGVVSNAELKSIDGVTFAGHEQSEGLFTEKENSKFKTASSLDFIVDQELKTMLESIIIPQQKNFIFSRLQENIKNNKNDQKVKVLSA